MLPELPMMVKRLRTLFPEIEQIQDETLRSQVLQVWEIALKEGQWTVEDLLKMPFTLLLKPCPITLPEHTRAVTQGAIAAAKAMQNVHGPSFKVNMDYLIAGGLLHDVGKPMEYVKAPDGDFTKSQLGKMLRHPFSGAWICREAGIPAEIVHIIAVHAREGDGGYRSTEAVFVHHADFMNFHSWGG
jgi:putative nucleotidyltransferase with HDIG domain